MIHRIYLIQNLVFYDELLLRYEYFVGIPHSLKSYNGLPSDP